MHVYIRSIYNACGTADFMYPQYLAFKEYAREIGMEDAVIFEESEGDVHSWHFWDRYIEKFVEVMPLKDRGFWRKWYDEEQRKRKQLVGKIL